MVNQQHKGALATPLCRSKVVPRRGIIGTYGGLDRLYISATLPAR
jgi:hypothetical protein